MAAVTRDTDATWQAIGTLCRERGWSKQRALWELQNGLPYRTFPPGYTIDWRHPETVRTLDIEAGTVQPVLEVFEGGFDRPILGLEVLAPVEAEAADADEADFMGVDVRAIEIEVLAPTEAEAAYADEPDVVSSTNGIEVLWPPDAEAADADEPSPSADAQTPPTPRRITDKELHACILEIKEERRLLAIKEERPDDPPPDEETLWKAVEERLGLTVARDRVRNARKKAAPQWVNKVGRPRKSAT